jgi:hypothetical protein
MRGSLRSWLALVRSILVYHGNRERHRRIDALYAQFVKPGDLAFDIGAHVVATAPPPSAVSARGSSQWSLSPALR